MDGTGRRHDAAGVAGIGVIVHNWLCSMFREEQHTTLSLHMYCTALLKLQLFLSLPCHMEVTC